MDTSELKAFLAERVDLFRNFPEAHMGELLANSRVHPFESNEPILQFGDISHSFGVVLAGQIALSPAALQQAGVVAAYSLADYCGSVRRAIEEAAEALIGLSAQTAAGLLRE